MRTLIAIPCFDKPDTEFVESLIGMRNVGDMTISFVTSSLIYDARNQLAQKAVEGGYDFVLWLDSDMVFAPDLAEKLFETIGDADLIAGIYFTRKRAPYKPTIFDQLQYEFDEQMHITGLNVTNYYDYPKDAVFPIKACGFGAVLTRVSLIEKIMANLWLPFTPLTGMGEDLSFCYRATSVEGKLLCNSSVKCGHIGRVVIDENIYLNQMKEAAGYVATD